MTNKKPFEVGDPVAHKAIQDTLGFIVRKFQLKDSVFFEVFWPLHPDNEEFGIQQTIINESWLKHYRTRKNKKTTS